MRKAVKIISLLLALVLALPCAALASEKDDSVGITWVPLGGSGFIIDELDGIPAYATRTCFEFVTRYYSTIYGVGVVGGAVAPQVNSYSSTGALDAVPHSFVLVTDAPQKGDIVYWSPANRGKGYSHYAIVKSYENGVMTLIEQNWTWNGQGAYERQYLFPSSYCDVFRLDVMPTIPTVSDPVTSAETETDIPPVIEAPAAPEIPDLGIGDLAVREPEAPAAAVIPEGAVEVKASSHSVTLDGEEVNPQGYYIEGNNYFMLRDIAEMLSGTAVSFSVGYDTKTRAITITTGEAYDSSSGGVNRELAAYGTVSVPLMYVNGEQVSLTAYSIGGNNYFKLRDIAEVLDFGVGFDSATATVILQSYERYITE